MVGWDFLGLPWVYLIFWSNIPAPSEMGFKGPVGQVGFIKTSIGRERTRWDEAPSREDIPRK